MSYIHFNYIPIDTTNIQQIRNNCHFYNMGEVMEINKQLRYYPAGKKSTQQDNVVAAYSFIIDHTNTT